MHNCSMRATRLVLASSLILGLFAFLSTNFAGELSYACTMNSALGEEAPQPSATKSQPPDLKASSNPDDTLEASGVIELEDPAPDIILKDPTFDELKCFILEDKTSQNKWVENVYECRHFATDVCNRAREAGWNSAFVLLCYERGQHSVVAFNTTDRGLVYIEPQTDAAIHPEVGGMYQGKEIKEILVAW